MPIQIQNQESPRLAGNQHHHNNNNNIPKTTNHHNNKPRKLIALFLKCIVMAIFLSLFFLFLLFLGFAALVLLHFLITSTAFRRRHRHRRRHHRSPPLVFPEETPYCGVSQQQSSTGDCAICLEGFKDAEFVRKLPDCGHVFHVKCVDSWLTRVLNCPVCRARVRVGSGDSVVSDEDWKRWWAVGVSG